MSCWGNNPGKLFDFLKDEQFKADFTKSLVTEASSRSCPNVGRTLYNRKRTMRHRAPTWGQASYAYDYTESAIAAATVEPPKATVKTSRVCLGFTPQWIPEA